MGSRPLATVALLLSGVLVLLAAGWPLIQKGYHYIYEREALSYFQKIEEGETRYRNVNNRFLPFTVQESAKALQELRLNPKEPRYYDFTVELADDKTFRIIASLKQRILGKWYLHNAQSRLWLIYEKKDGQKGKMIL